MKHGFAALLSITLILALGILLAGCTGTPAYNATPPPSAGPTSGITPGGVGNTTSEDMNVVTSNNQFAGDLYRELAKETGTGESNIFFSPFSISSALALTYEGAGGTTADEIRSVFHFPANNTSRREGFAAENAEINNGDAGYTLSTANALWAEKTSAFLPGYINIAQQVLQRHHDQSRFCRPSRKPRARPSTTGWLEKPITGSRICSPPAASIP